MPAPRAFGNVQGNHVRESQYHDALRRHSLFVQNASHGEIMWQGKTMVEKLRDIVPGCHIFANVQPLFIGNWGQNVTYWNDLRSTMDDDSFYWLNADGTRKLSPMWWPQNEGDPFPTWPGHDLQPKPEVYTRYAHFVAARHDKFDGIFVDSFANAFWPYRAAGLDIPPGAIPTLTLAWKNCRRLFLQEIRRIKPTLKLVCNLNRVPYESADYALMDGVHIEFATIIDLNQFVAHPSIYNVAWQREFSSPGVVQPGDGLPFLQDPV